MNRWRAAGTGLAGLGLADSLYLLAEYLNTQATLYCPTIGIVNCATVTSSEYSRFLGIPVALLGTLWFIAMMFLFVINSASPNHLLLLPLWMVGVVFAGYLIFVELFLLHAICPYCTLAHVTGMVLGAPSIKLTLA